MAATKKNRTTKDAPSGVELGWIDVPDGVLVILDPGLGRAWKHEAPPRDVATGEIAFGSHVAVAVTSIPRDRPLSVVGVPMSAGGEPSDEARGRWRSLDVVVADGRWKRVEQVGRVSVEHGQLLFAGWSPLSHFRMWDSLDGLADYVFFGRAAAALAERVGATKLADGLFGWRDIPMGSVAERAQPLQALVETERLDVVVDYRPHCNLERLNGQIRETDERVGHLVLDGARVLGCDNRWGDGLFDVVACYDTRGALVRVRVELGTPEREAMLHRVLIRSRLAVVSRVVLDGREPIRFADRMRASAETDSGWVFTGGVEPDGFMSDPAQVAIVSLGALLDRFEHLAAIVEAPIGSSFAHRRGRWVRG